MRLSKRLKLFLALLIVAMAIGFGLAYHHQSTQLDQLKRSPAQQANKEAAKLIAAVSKHFALPKEKPTIATVDDVSKLKGQTFFKSARNGDKVLMYTRARKAFL